MLRIIIKHPSGNTSEGIC